MLRVEGLHVHYGHVPALRGVDLEVREGEIVTVIGANGAGKTTLLMSISGVVRPRQGKIQFLGRPIEKAPSSTIVALGISQVPEGRRIFPDLTVADNIAIGAYLRKGQPAEIKRDRDWVHSLFPVLAERATQLAGLLSGGEQQMLAMARGLMARPKVLLLDEPSMGLAPLVIKTIFHTLREINQHGTTVLLVEQNAHKALELAQRGYVLEGGQILFHDTCENLRRDPRVRDAYLGEEVAHRQVAGRAASAGPA